MKNKWVGFIGSVIGVPVIWTLLDYIYNTVITREAFQFKIGGNLIIPLIVGAAVGYTSFIRKKDK